MEPSIAPQPSPRPGFLRRHRATILLAGVVLYTLALGVAVCDEAFHLGLFPTALERQARDQIALFDSPDEATRREAADTLVRRVDAFVAIPELIRALGSGSAPVREGASACLRRLAAGGPPFDPAAPPAERRAAVAAWGQWWRENKGRF
ncbi:MAG TPA: hypothetical protein PLE19_15470 [Planctomycetota bacterium]|nr:hypothetical protein [Planctomycetota bacterium]HRR83036.1 hypothetical protein [Planctomycetota bacterium]HRT94986.1 hypothetical protein [Planctomycetota bacterium]